MKYARIALLAALVPLAACSNQNSGVPATVTTSNTKATLELAVGTLNDQTNLLYGTAGTYLNVVTSFRNPTGTSAFYHPSETGQIFLTGPNDLSLNLGNLYAYGQAAGANFTLGEPPAFSPQNLVGGYSTGYVITGVPPVPGQYAISTTVSTSGQTLTFSAAATLPASPTVLATNPNPTNWVSDGQGGGTLTMSNNPGATESLIFFQAQVSPYPYTTTVELKGSATSVTIPDGTLAAGASYWVFSLGADYPMVEDAPPNSTVPNPQLTGPNGTADLATSGVITVTE